MTSPARPIRLEDLSPIEVTFCGEISGPGDRWDIVIMTCVGKYRQGSGGEIDARYLRAMADSAVKAWRAEAPILDLSEFDDDSGDDLNEIHFIGHLAFGNESLPLSLIVGPRCERGIRAFFPPDRPGSIAAPEWIFRDMESARAYIDHEMTAIRAVLGERA